MPPTSTRTASRTARRLRAPLERLVRDVGEAARARQARLRSEHVRSKGVGDFVTEVDLQSERRLRRALTSLLPDAGFLGEETAPIDLEREHVWVVDPIDGTSNFARGLPMFAVSVALLRRGRPLLGAVHCYPEDATYSAVHREGARRGRTALRRPRGRFDDGAIFGCQWFRGSADMGFLGALQSGGARIRTLGSTVVQLCDCAAGRLDGNVQQQGRVWDFAAAGLIAEESGLRFTDWAGERVFPLRDLQREHTATVAAPARVHREILSLLAPFCRS
ncbi:MAG: inositol monophosphatase family protein [Planctomycetota bacterium]